jgi:hypothetical protein
MRAVRARIASRGSLSARDARDDAAQDFPDDEDPKDPQERIGTGRLAENLG